LRWKQDFPQFEVEARLWGSLAHKVMEQLFKEGHIEIDDIDARLFQCLEAALKQFPIDQFWGKVAKEIFKKLLPKIKEQEQALRIQGFAPVMVEKKLTADINGLKLKGKIDRIDKRQGARGQEVKGSREKDSKMSQVSGVRCQEKEIQNSKLKTQNSVILLDYKTGNVDSDSLQMALYALMWKENSPEPVDKVGYYSLKEGKVSLYPKKISMEEYLDASLATAEKLVKNMRKGYFPPEPLRASECRYCSHSPFCER